MTAIVTVTPNPAIDHTIFIPNFSPGKVNRAEGERFDAGGKGLNVASFLKDFGLDDVSASGFLGKENEELFEKYLEKRGIRNEFVSLDGKTRTNIKIVDKSKGEITDINFPGFNCTTRDCSDLKERLTRLAKTHRWFILSGSLPPGAPDELFYEITILLKSLRLHVAVDTSGEALKKAAKARPDIVKPNLAEFSDLAGISNPTEEAIVSGLKELLKSGIRTVVLSMGEKGAIFASEGRFIRTIPPEVQVLSTVGAGDAMVAGLVAGESIGCSFEERARLATAFSAAALTKLGPGRTSRERVYPLIKDIKIEEVRT